MPSAFDSVCDRVYSQPVALVVVEAVGLVFDAFSVAASFGLRCGI